MSHFLSNKCWFQHQESSTRPKRPHRSSSSLPSSSTTQVWVCMLIALPDIIINPKGIQLSSLVHISYRKEPPDPNAPLPPLPLHLHPPPPVKRPSLDGKKERSGFHEFHLRLHVVTGVDYFGKNKLTRSFSALNPCVVCHSRKESSDSKPSSQKKTSDREEKSVKKDRFRIWKLFDPLLNLD